jgi:hypothetical protein
MTCRPMSACASGALGERRRDKRIVFPMVAKPYLLSFRIETPYPNSDRSAHLWHTTSNLAWSHEVL